MHWLGIKLFWYSDITSADLGIRVSFASPLLRPWIPLEAIEEQPEINRPKPSSDLWITTFGPSSDFLMYFDMIKSVRLYIWYW